MSVLIRDEKKFFEALPSKVSKRLAKVHIGDATDVNLIRAAVAGQDCVIEALGNAQRPTIIAALIPEMEVAGVGSFVCLGGTPALLLPDGAPAGPALQMQRLADLHLHTLSLLRASRLSGWTQVSKLSFDS